MKIALLNNLYSPYNRGGAETVVKKMISDLKSQGHEVFLLTTQPKNKSLRLATPDENANLKIYYFPSHYYSLTSFSARHKIIWHFANLFSYKKTAAIKKVLLNEKPELVISHNLMGLGFLLPQALKKLGIRHEHYLHDIQLLYPSGLMLLGKEKIIDGFSAKIYQFFTRTFFASPAKIISPSSWLLEQHRQRGFFKDSKIEIKNLSQSIEKAEQTEKAEQMVSIKTETNNNYIFVGQIEEHKGIIFLLNTFLNVLKTKPEFTLKVIGDGSLLTEAKKISAGYEQIEFFGRLQAEEIKNLMRLSDCLIVPSLCYENSPMTISEAHTSGLKVLAASIGGIPEIINNNDKLFKPGDERDLMNKILDQK